MNDSDAVLVSRCREGDQDAWRELVVRHTRRVFAVAYQFTGRVDLAEDLSQEVFLKVYRHLHRFAEQAGEFPAWLTTVARRHAIDHYRQTRQERQRRVEDPELLGRAVESGEAPDSRAEREQRARFVHKALRALPPDLRAPLILCDLQGVPYAEIAATLSLPLGTVKSRINRARLELARRLESRFRPQAQEVAVMP